MADIIEVDITITTGTDIDLDIIIIMDTDIITDVDIEQLPDAMDITETEMNITDTDLTGTTTEVTIIDPILITEIEVIIQEVIIGLQDPEQQAEDTDKTLILSFLMKGFSSYLEMISKIFPTINPPNVPTIYPIIAMSTPMGIRALE